MKINVDASILKSLNAAGICVVARDFTGNVIAWCQRKIDFLNCSETAETIAVKHGIDLAQAFGFHDVIIESDCLSVVKAITYITTCLAVGGHIVEEIKLLSSKFHSIIFIHIFRTANTMAHDLSRHVTSDRDGFTILPS